VTDLWRGGYPLSLDNPSFRAVAKRTSDVSRSVLDVVRSGGLSAARNTLAFVLSRPLGAAVVVTTLSTSTFCAVGYVHYKHAASAERVAAQRAERVNADLQDALGRLRDELAATKARIDTSGDDGKGSTAAERDNTDRVAQFTRGLEQPHDLQLTVPQRPTWAVSLSWEPRSQSLDQNQVKPQQLSAERDEAADERDQLRARVDELEQKLSLLQSRRGSRSVAHAATVRPVPPGQAPEAEAAIASATAAVVQAPEHPRQVAAVVFPTKNFTPPGWAPSNFSNESAPIRGNPTRRPAEANAKE
jgi:hypothetical protein